MEHQMVSGCAVASSASNASNLPGLLRLPRELRDMIFSYTLHHPSGLYYCRDQDYKSSFSTSKESFHEFNQLKYTCKQLRDETLGLELKLGNDLIFLFRPTSQTEYMKMLPGNQFLGFLDMCHEAWRCRIRRVYLRDPGDTRQHLLQRYEKSKSGILDLHVIVGLCHNYPNFFVLWEHPMPTFLGDGQDCPVSLVSDGLMFSMGFRNSQAHRAQVWKTIKLLHLDVALASATVYRAYWRRDAPQSHSFHVSKYSKTSVEAPNFRLLPDDGPFDEEKFRNNIERWGEGYHSEQKPKTREETEMWIQLAREWYTNGI
jgi:hypothetical protein